MSEKDCTKGCCVLDFQSIGRNWTNKKSWQKILSAEQSNDDNEASNDKSLMSLAQTLPVSETLNEKRHGWMQARNYRWYDYRYDWKSWTREQWGWKLC